MLPKGVVRQKRNLIELRKSKDGYKNSKSLVHEF